MSIGLHSDLHFAPPRVEVEKRGDGTLILRTAHTLAPCPRAVGVASTAISRPGLLRLRPNPVLKGYRPFEATGPAR